MDTWVSSQAHHWRAAVLAHRRIGGLEQAGVGVDQASATFFRGHGIAEASPLLGEDPPHVAGHPLDLPDCGGNNAEEDGFRDPVRVLSA